MRHSQMATYLATMSPKPAHSMRMGAWARISASSRMPWGHWLFRETFTWSRSMEEVAEAKPSMDGAVPTMALTLPDL